MMKRFFCYTALAFGFLSLNGCITVDGFQLLRNDIKPKGKSIVVVSGLNHDLNAFVAESMTASLGKETTFRVISQKEVDKKVKDYPFNIQGPYKKAYFNIEDDYSNTDVKTLKEIAGRVNADYVYAMWVPTATTYDQTYSTFDIIAQLYEFPSGRPVGQGHFMAASSGVHSNCCLFGSPATAEDDKKGIRDMMDMVAKEIGTETGMAKAVKTAK